MECGEVEGGIDALNFAAQTKKEKKRKRKRKNPSEWQQNEVLTWSVDDWSMIKQPPGVGDDEY